MSGLRVLAISGSPRRDGNTERLIDSVLDGASSAGAVTAKLRLADLRIEFCRGCLACYPGGRTRCAVHDDDMTDVVAAMSRADVWVLGTPVYCYGPSGLFKVFLDRWISLLPEVYAETAAVGLIPLHMPAAGAESTRALLRTVCRGFGITYLGDLVAPGLLHREDLDAHPGFGKRQSDLGGGSGRALRSVRGWGTQAGTALRRSTVGIPQRAIDRPPCRLGRQSFWSTDRTRKKNENGTQEAT